MRARIAGTTDGDLRRRAGCSGQPCNWFSRGKKRSQFRARRSPRSKCRGYDECSRLRRDAQFNCKSKIVELSYFIQDLWEAVAKR
jgi:hypothetical protein